MANDEEDALICGGRLYGQGEVVMQHTNRGLSAFVALAVVIQLSLLSTGGFAGSTIPSLGARAGTVPSAVMDLIKAILKDAARFGLDTAGRSIMGAAWPYLRLVIHPIIDRFPELLLGEGRAQTASDSALRALASDGDLFRNVESRFSSLERGQAEILARLAEVQKIIADHESRLDRLEERGGLISILPPVIGMDCQSKPCLIGVEAAGINSHQPVRPWCPPGTFIVALDLDSSSNYAPHDSPVVGQAMCAGPGSRWGGWPFWVGVEAAGVNSHQPVRPWCPPGTFIVALDLDGPRDYSPHDSPVVGQAMCASLAGTADGWAETFWRGVGIKSHQAGEQWCPSGTFAVALDLDGPRNYTPHDTPIVGQVMCARPRR